MTDVDPKTRRPVVTSAGKFMGWNTIFGRDGDRGAPYMTRIWFWRLRLHIFHRGDQDPDPHDHPWDFWTFPLTSYVEEVTRTPTFLWTSPGEEEGVPEGWDDRYTRRTQIVPAFRLSFRPATHCHRVLGAFSGRYDDSAFLAEGHDGIHPIVDLSRKIVTLVWISKPKRKWGFLKNRDGRWCWIDWRDYILAGGKDAPCE